MSTTTDFTDEQLADWDTKLTAARQSELANLQSVADKWAGSLAAVIAAVGSISIIVVPKALSTFNNATAEDFALAFALLAGLLGVTAMILAVSVSQGWQRINPQMDARAYAQRTIDLEAAGPTRLRQSRFATLAALLCIVTASVISQIDTVTGGPPAVNVLVVHTGGDTTCVPVATATGPTDIVSVTVVAHC